MGAYDNEINNTDESGAHVPILNRLGGLLDFLPQPYKPFRQMPLYRGKSGNQLIDEDWGYYDKPTSQVNPLTPIQDFQNEHYRHRDDKFLQDMGIRRPNTVTTVGPEKHPYTGSRNRMHEQPFFPENFGYNRPKTYKDGEVVYNKSIDTHIVEDQLDAFWDSRYPKETQVTMPWMEQWAEDRTW